MKKLTVFFFLLPLLLLNITGCVFILGGALGAAGGYAISKDTIQGETDRSFESIWDSAVAVSEIIGTIKYESQDIGRMELDVDKSRVNINIERLTSQTIRLKVSARKYLMPNIGLAQKIFIKIIERAK